MVMVVLKSRRYSIMENRKYMRKFFLANNKFTLNRLKGNSDGFTAVEFLIAMAVFSFVLTLSTIGFIQISQMYQQGVARQKAQDATRHIQADITRTIHGSDHIQVAGSGGSTIICSGNYRFFTRENAEDNTVLYKQAINTDANPSGSCLPNGGLSLANASQLVSNELVVLNFDVTPFNAFDDDSGYRSAQIVLRVGTEATQDLIENGESCDPSQAGSHFCAVSEQVTIVTAREAP